MKVKDWKRRCSILLTVCLLLGTGSPGGNTVQAAALSEPGDQTTGERQKRDEKIQEQIADVSGGDGNMNTAEEGILEYTGSMENINAVTGGDASAAADILNLDFEDVEEGKLPDGLRFSNAANSQAKASIKTMGDNHVLVLDQSVDNSNANYNPGLTWDLGTEYDHVVLSYSIAASTPGGVLYLPTVINGSKRLTELSLNTYKGDYFKYQTAGSSTWYEIQPYEMLRWYSVKIVYDNTGEEASYQLYIDGNPIELAYPQPKNSGAVTGINMNLYRKNTGVFFVDNIRMTEEDHEPVLPGELVLEEQPTPSDSVAYSQNFENVMSGSLPEGWAYSNKEDTTAAGTALVDGNRVLQLEHPATQQTSFSMRYPFAGGASAAKAVLKYRVKAGGTSGALYLPSFYSDTKQLVKLAFNAGKLQRDNDGKGWKDIMSVEAGRWYEIELMLDTENKVYDLYVDGQIVISQETPYLSEKINRMGLGIYKSTVNTYYLDDFEILDYVQGEGVAFEQSSYEIVKGRTRQLSLSFTPENTSCRSAVFTSSDENVAQVDGLGNVTALAEGIVTITAVPSLVGLGAVTAQVTVTNVQPESILVTPEKITIPRGGHLFLQAEVLPEDAGNKEVSFASADPEIASVDEWGEVIAGTVGTTQLFVTSKEAENVQTAVTITVVPETVMQQIYVSLDGNDVNDGSQNAPVATIGRAMELVRGLNGSMTGNIEVILADGYYQQEETLHFNEADGGTNEYYVVWRHEGDGEAVIGGKRQITGFTLYDSSRNIYAADAEGLTTRQLYVNNVRAVRARSEGGLSNPAALKDTTANIGFTCTNTEFLSFAHPEDLELIFQEQWTNPRCGVASVAAAGDKVQLIMDQPGWTYVSDKGGTSASTPVYYENALELLDEPGEWYLDQTAGKLYYMPRPWEDMSEAEVTAPVIEALVTVEGSDYDHMVQNIRFEGITFADTTWNRPSTVYGHADAQNNHIREHGVPDRLPDAAVTVKRANSIWFTECTFTRMGITALKMVEGVQNSPVTGSRFYDISGSAVNIGDPYTNDADNYNPSDIRKLMKNCDVTNNYIHDIGVDYQSAAAVSVGFAADMDLSCNEIFNIPYSAFHIGYGWAKRFENVQKNMVMEHNFIHDLMGDGIYDGGAFYFNGNSGGSEDNYNLVADNYIRNQMDLNAPLYADEGTTYWRWERNVVDLSESMLWHNNSDPRWMLVYVPTIEHLKVDSIYTTTNNKYINEGAPDVVLSNIHVVPDAVWPAEAQQIIDESGLQEQYSWLRAQQAERISTNLPEESLNLGIGDSFAVSVTGQDGRDREVSLADAVLAYEVKDPQIASVSDQGVVEGLKSGITTLRVYVVSNHILDVLERDLYVGDVFSRIGLRGVEQDQIVMGVTSRGFQLEPYGLTDLNRELTLEKISYAVADTAVAAVSESGYVTPVSAGKTTITITAQGEGRIVSWNFAVTIEKEQEFVPDNLREIFDASYETEWELQGGSLEVTDGVQVVSTLSKFATFTGCKYRNELMTFKLRINANGKGGWPSIVLRAQSADKAVSGGATGYIICFGASGLELHRFVGSQRTVIYGSLDNFTSIGGPVITPEPLTHEELHDVQVGALTNGDTVRLLLIIDGETVFDFVDEEEDAITEPGYFGIVGRGETFTLIKDTTIPDEPEYVSEADKTKLQEAADRAAALKRSDYTQESYDAMCTVLGKANAVLADEAADQAAVDQALAELLAAIEALKPAEQEPGDDGNEDNKPENGGNDGNEGNKPENGGNNGNEGNKPEDGGNNGNEDNKPEDGGNDGNENNKPKNDGSVEVSRPEDGTGSSCAQPEQNTASPKTGQKEDILTYVMIAAAALALICAAAAGMLQIRKREDKDF